MRSKGRILQVRLGHDANCSALDYMAGIITSYMGYLMLFLLLVVAQVVLMIKSLAEKPWIGRLRMGLWVIPHLLALAALLFWAFDSGAMRYASFICVGALVIVMLVSLGVGALLIRKAGSDGSFTVRSIDEGDPA